MNWNLQDIFKNKDEFIKEKNNVKLLLKDIKKYEGILCNSLDNLYDCYSLYEEVLEKFEKVYSYGMLTYHLDMSDTKGSSMFKEVEALGAEISISTAFITPEISYANEELINEYLKDSKLSKYVREIRDILDKKKHILDKESENLLANFTEIFSSPENTFDILTNAEFKFGTIINERGKEVELTESTYSLYLKSSDINVRKQAFNLMYKKYSEFINTISELYIANVKIKTTDAKLRKYKSTLEKAVIEDDSSIKVYNSLIGSITENISINYDFIKLKKKLLKLPEIHMYDLYVNPFELEKEKINIDEAKNQILEALTLLGDEYQNKLNEAFDNNWIDLYPKPNKRAGGYSMGVYGVHPFILINFVSDKRDVGTIAHELGHAIHSYYSNKNQNVIDANYTIMVAEVASTVNEILLSDYQIKIEKDNNKKAILLYELLEMIRATFFRQSMFAEFEKIVHEKVESGEIITSKNLNNIYYDLNKKYFGNDIYIDEQIKFEWARIPHFYTDFYVYKYATGISAAISIATKIIDKEAGFVNKYIEMLKQGCTKKSIDLLKMVDVDLESKETYTNTINFYKQKIEELKKLL